MILGHLGLQVLVLRAVTDDDLVPLGDVLKDRRTGVDRFHLLAVAILDAAGKLLLRAQNTVVHRLAPPLVVDGAFDDQSDLDDLGGGRGVQARAGERQPKYKSKTEQTCQYFLHTYPSLNVSFPEKQWNYESSVRGFGRLSSAEQRVLQRSEFTGRSGDLPGVVHAARASRRP